MKRIAFLVALSISTTTLAAGSANAGDDWKPLFDGKTLNGWTQKNGTAKYEVADGTIHGTTVEGSPNSFLCSDKEYGNFELEFEVKVHNNLNSGCQIRSKTKATDGKKKNEKFGRVYGPQCEIEASGVKGAEAGYIYGEAYGGGWRTPAERLKPHKVMQDGEWNKFRIVANGPRIQTWINGKAIEDLNDEEIFKTHPKGFIGLQVHGIKAGSGPYDVAWKNIRIKELK
ncbi:MAG: 3-keto-disaccharide hydrolase [Planctomycetales bacterium]|jgi:hypothetical protein